MNMCYIYLFDLMIWTEQFAFECERVFAIKPKSYRNTHIFVIRTPQWLFYKQKLSLLSSLCVYICDRLNCVSCENCNSNDDNDFNIRVFFYSNLSNQNISCEIRLNGNVCYCLCPNIVNCTRFIICTLTGWTELSFVYCLQSETKYNCLIENWDRCHIVYYIVSIVSIYIRTSKRSIWNVECLQLQRSFWTDPDTLRRKCIFDFKLGARAPIDVKFCCCLAQKAFPIDVADWVTTQTIYNLLSR